MEHTPNMGFTKPGYSDPVDIGEINKNFDIIDGKFNADGVGALPNYPWQDATDFNTLTTDGVYECQGVNINSPYSGIDTHFQVIVLSHNPSGWIRQIAFNVRDNNAYQRGCFNGTWSKWTLIGDFGYLGANLMTPETDTVTSWVNTGSGYVFYSELGHLVGQPNQYGFLLNIQYYGDCFQLLRIQNAGPTYIRSGNVGGNWAGNGWYQIYDSQYPPTANDVGALPLSGGTMTGIITSDATFAKTSGADKYMRLFGGTSLEDGAALYLTGQGDRNAGSFLLYATNSTNGKKILHGKPDGTLLWNNKQLYGQHNITSGTGALTAGSSTLINGNIYLQYE